MIFDLKKLNLTKTEKLTFRYHLIYSIIEGIIAGLLSLNEFVFIKSLNGTNYLLGILFLFSLIVLLPTIFFNELATRIRNKRKLLIITAVVTRISFLVFLFFPKNILPEDYNVYHIVFLTVFMLYFLAMPIVVPNINLFLKSNYSIQNFGKLYSYSVTANLLVILLVTLSFGLLLDFDSNAYRLVYPLISILGIASVWFFTKITVADNFVQVSEKTFLQSIKVSFQKMLTIIRKKATFRDFEFGFMLYGISYMISIPIITIFLTKQLQLNYSSIAMYKNLYSVLAIVSTPFFGKLMGKIDPRKLSVYSYLFFMLHLLFIVASEYFPAGFEILHFRFVYLLIPSIVCFGFFTSSITILFYIGSSYYCSAGDSADYQAVHLTFTGIRGSFAPILGVLIFEATNYSVTFSISILVLIIAILLLKHSMKIYSHQ